MRTRASATCDTKMNDYDYQQIKRQFFFRKDKKNFGTKLPAPLETLQRAFKLLNTN